MPLYEYRCTQCAHEFEVFHHVGDPGGPCPVCGGQPRRVFKSVGLIFKGSGFHTTDYRKSATKDGAAPKEPAKESSSESPSKSPNESTRKSTEETPKGGDTKS